MASATTSNRKIVHLVASTAVTAVLVWFVFSRTDPAIFISMITGADLRYLTVYLVLVVVALFLRAARYQIMLSCMVSAEAVPGKVRMLILTAIRNALVDFFPARLGELSFFYIINRYGIALVTATSVFGLCLALDIVVLLALVFFGVIAASITGTFQTELHYVIPGLIFTLVFLFICIRYADGILKRASTTLSGGLLKNAPLPRFIKQCLEQVSGLTLRLSNDLQAVRKTGRYPLLVGLTVGLRAAKYMSLYFVLAAIVKPVLLSELNPLISTLAFISAEASASLPVSGIMGFGAYEGAAAAIIELSNVEIPSVTSVILAVHIITQVAGYFFGLLGIVAFFMSVFGRGRADD